MDLDALRAVQTPLKARYKREPEAAVVTLRASGDLGGDNIACSVETGRALVTAGLHPASGGDGSLACSGDMLLQALVACAGVTLRAVATALEFRLDGGTVRAEGDLDFCGTLGVDKAAPVGFRAVRLRFDLVTGETDERIATLTRLTERYCVVLQTLRTPPHFALDVAARPS
ncbi:MAG TPA: OsmC family protein [Rhodospirillales bacterium]|nr:OsmC family protein [Rhodospirillales bacterium]